MYSRACVKVRRSIRTKHAPSVSPRSVLGKVGKVESHSCASTPIPCGSPTLEGLTGVKGTGWRRKITVEHGAIHHSPIGTAQPRKDTGSQSAQTLQPAGVQIPAEFLVQNMLRNDCLSASGAGLSSGAFLEPTKICVLT